MHIDLKFYTLFSLKQSVAVTSGFYLIYFSVKKAKEKRKGKKERKKKAQNFQI